MDDEMCLRSTFTSEESISVKFLLESHDSKCVCSRGTVNSGITPWKETHVERKENKQRVEGKVSKNTTTVTRNRNFDRKEKSVEYSFHHYQDYSMYALQYRKEHTQGSSENGESRLLGYNIPDPYLPTTMNASVLEERMRLIEAISEYYQKQSNLHRACVNLTGTEKKGPRQELPQITSINAKTPTNTNKSTNTKKSNRSDSITSESVSLERSGLDSPRFRWMESIANGDFHEVGASCYKNPKRKFELDVIANSRRYLLTQPAGLNAGNLIVGNPFMPFKQSSTNVSKCEVFSSSEVPRTPRIDKKTRPANSIIAVIGHSTGDLKPDGENKQKRKGENFRYCNHFHDNSKTNSNTVGQGKIQPQGHLKRNSFSDKPVIGSITGVLSDR